MEILTELLWKKTDLNCDGAQKEKDKNKEKKKKENGWYTIKTHVKVAASEFHSAVD